MTRLTPTSDLPLRLRALDTVAFHAMRLPDVPADRLERLQEIRRWTSSYGALFGQPLPKLGTPREAEIQREIRAHHEYVEQDRRARQSVSRRLQNTAADGSGEPVGPDWPYAE